MLSCCMGLISEPSCEKETTHQFKIFLLGLIFFVAVVVATNEFGFSSSGSFIYFLVHIQIYSVI